MKKFSVSKPLVWVFMILTITSLYLYSGYFIGPLLKYGFLAIIIVMLLGLPVLLLLLMMTRVIDHKIPIISEAHMTLGKRLFVISCIATIWGCYNQPGYIPEKIIASLYLCVWIFVFVSILVIELEIKKKYGKLVWD